MPHVIARMAVLTAAASLVLCELVGCNPSSPPPPMDLATLDRASSTDGPLAGDLAAPPDLGAVSDMTQRPDGCLMPYAGCGWAIGEEQPACGAFGAPMPAGVKCTGDWCGTGECGANQDCNTTCCNVKTGAVRGCYYRAGSCPCSDEVCEPMCLDE